MTSDLRAQAIKLTEQYDVPPAEILRLLDYILQLTKDLTKAPH